MRAARTKGLILSFRQPIAAISIAAKAHPMEAPSPFGYNESTAMHNRMRPRLQAMMFLQYFISGSITPIFSLYLRSYLHFTGGQAGAVMAMSSASAFAAPIIGSFIADRLIRTERLYVICLLSGGVLMLLLSLQRSFPGVLLLYLAYTLLLGSTYTMSTIVALHHERDRQRRFGQIRMWGTIGFIAAGWLGGRLWLGAGGPGHSMERLPGLLTISALVSIALGIYALTLPRAADIQLIGPRNAHVAMSAGRDLGLRRLFPRDSLRVFTRPLVLLFVVASFLTWSADSFENFGIPLFLSHLSVPTDSIMPLLTIGQMVEVATMALLGFFLTRFGFRFVFVVGAAAESIRFLIFALGSPFALLVFGISLHGLYFGLFYGAASLFLDAFSTPATRAAVQQLFTITTGGFGALLGNFAAGGVLDVALRSPLGFHLYWMVPSGLALFSFMALALRFRERRTEVAGIA